MTRTNAKIIANHKVEFGLHQNSASKEATVTSSKDDRKHLTWRHAQGGEIKLEYSGCEFATAYEGYGIDQNHTRNIGGKTLNHSRDSCTSLIVFKNYQVSVPNRLGRTDVWVNQSMKDQAICPQGKDVGIQRPGLIYDAGEKKKLAGVNHTYQVPNAGVLRLTYAELMDDHHDISDQGAKNKLGLFGADTGRACSLEYCHDVSRVCGIKHGSRKVEVSMRLTRISNIDDDQTAYNNGRTANAEAAIDDLHNKAHRDNKAGGQNQCGFAMRISEPCLDNLVVNVNTAAQNKVIGGEISYERYVRLGSWCHPSTGGCPDRVGIKFQVPDHLRSDAKAGKDYSSTIKADKNTPNVCQISYCTRLLGFDVPMFIARATNLDGDSKKDAWLCGVTPHAEVHLEQDAEWKGCPCPEGGEDGEDQE